jgi:hypothetical protein
MIPPLIVGISIDIIQYQDHHGIAPAKKGCDGHFRPDTATQNYSASPEPRNIFLATYPKYNDSIIYQMLFVKEKISLRIKNNQFYKFNATVRQMPSACRKFSVRRLQA